MLSFKRYSLLIPGICFSLLIHGQQSLTDDRELVNHQLWIDFYPYFSINDKLQYYGDAGFRTIVNERSWNRIFARPSVRYHFNRHWEVHLGLGMFYIFDKYDINRLEITPWQGVKLNWPNLYFFNFNHLVRIEERFSYLTENWHTSFDIRFRYKISGRINLCDNCTEFTFYIPFYGEFFFPVGNSIEEFFRNRGRAGAGLGYHLNSNWRVEALFNFQRSRSGPNDELEVSDYAYQLKIRKRWDFND